ncbi:hypothetical protein [Bradyrhizobium sp. SZCCHNR3003]|uniref:hypothetical protein n=1 Tax=Bradyrhizobium sp. SZCCHNR3003 TaxID=3057387 RepID=UPI002916BC6D|nr:hypothetical protein [Bradyrhizobium sp. SZCCHNR3003]
MTKPYSGHAPGHVRDTFGEAVEAFYHWNGTDPEPTVEFEVHYEPRQVSLSEACNLVWNVSDIMPGWMVDLLRGNELDLKASTYAAGARAMHRWIKERQLTKA